MGGARGSIQLGAVVNLEDLGVVAGEPGRRLLHQPGQHVHPPAHVGSQHHRHLNPTFQLVDAVVDPIAEAREEVLLAKMDVERVQRLALRVGRRLDEALRLLEGVATLLAVGPDG